MAVGVHKASMAVSVHKEFYGVILLTEFDLTNIKKMKSHNFIKEIQILNKKHNQKVNFTF
jgi:hypothetical protein